MKIWRWDPGSVICLFLSRCVDQVSLEEKFKEIRNVDENTP